MGLFGFGKNKRKSENKAENEKYEKGAFVAFVLLKEKKWDRDKFVEDLKSDWSIDISGQIDHEDAKYKDIIYAETDGMRLMASFMDMPVPNGEVEHYAAANYMWKDAVEEVKKHQAQIIIAVMGEEAGLLERGKLYTKAIVSALKQDSAIAVYGDGAVYEPGFYCECATLLENDGLPILNWVWFGIYVGEEKAGVYTYGMKKFGKDEIEVYVPRERADLNELRNFVLSIVTYVLDGDVVLRDGETIGFSEEQKLPIHKSKGIALDGETIKIEYMM